MGLTCAGIRLGLEVASVNKIDIYVLFQEVLLEVQVKTITAAETPVSYPSSVLEIGVTAEM